MITGASGFLGQHAVEAVRRRHPDASVIGFDLRPPPHGVQQGVDFVRGSVEDEAALASIMSGASVVIHLAGLVNPELRHFDRLWRANVDGARNTYAAAVAAGCGLFVHLSSAGIYGPPRPGEPFSEDDPADPRTPYQRTKWEGELALRRSDGTGTVLNVLRPAGAYGPGSTLEIPMYRRVESRRWSFEMPGGVVVQPTYVTDIVEAMMALVDEPAPHRAVFNVGGDRPILLADLRALVADVLGVLRRRIVVPRSISGPLVSVLDSALARAGRRNPLRGGLGRGIVFTNAVDDGAFRARYPDAPRMSIEAGVRAHIDWARGEGLLPFPGERRAA